MEQRKIGGSGLRVSAVGLGCNNFGWKIDVDASRRVVHRALDLGITLFDTADMYGSPPGRSEEVLGELIEGHREKIVLTTKFGMPPGGGPSNNSRHHVLASIEHSLRRLRTDWVDIYMMHGQDPVTPIEETLRVLDDLVTSGKVRYVACSNLSPWRLVEAKWCARELRAHSFIASQNQYSLLARDPERELIPALLAYDMALIPFFPLASGLLTGKYLDGAARGRLADNFLNLGSHFLTERNSTLVRVLKDFAEERGHTLLELAMSWLSAKPVVAGIIAGATDPEQVERNVGAAGWRLTNDDLAEIDRLISL